MIYQTILRAFNKAKVRFVVVGGVAFNLLGGYRATGDLDILLAMDEDNLKKAIKILIKKGYHVKQPVNPLDFADKKIRDTWVKEKNLKAFNFYKDTAGYEEVDIIVDTPVSFTAVLRGAKKIEAGQCCIPVASIDALIAMKRAAGREKDLLDVQELKIIKKLGKR
jgi:hypothetical protein